MKKCLDLENKLAIFAVTRKDVSKQVKEGFAIAYQLFVNLKIHIWRRSLGEKRSHLKLQWWINLFYSLKRWSEVWILIYIKITRSIVILIIRFNLLFFPFLGL